jgi:predicted Fe-S protein YdhL (DUF1289 family)
VIPSPCINVCKMADDLCAGCHRTLDEIARWGNAPDAEKQRILAAVAQRRLTIESELICNCSD